MKVRTQNNGYSKDGGQRDNSGGFGDYSKHGHTKNCQYDGQVPNTIHLKRDDGIKDEVYFVRNKRDVWSINIKPNTNAIISIKFLLLQKIKIICYPLK